MLKSNFCLNYPVTLTATEFVSPIDVPEEAEDELVTKQDWTKEQLVQSCEETLRLTTTP